MKSTLPKTGKFPRYQHKIQKVQNTILTKQASTFNLSSWYFPSVPWDRYVQIMHSFSTCLLCFLIPPGLFTAVSMSLYLNHVIPCLFQHSPSATSYSSQMLQPVGNHQRQRHSRFLCILTLHLGGGRRRMPAGGKQRFMCVITVTCNVPECPLSNSINLSQQWLREETLII